MPKIIINGKEIEFEKGMTVLQACELADVEIPRFCYHEKLSIAGNCRMCLVEMERSPKPIASCAMPAAEGMNIKTNTEFVKKARKGVISDETKVSEVMPEINSLTYRGYAVQDLAKQCRFEQVAYLLLHGEVVKDQIKAKAEAKVQAAIDEKKAEATEALKSRLPIKLF